MDWHVFKCIQNKDKFLIDLKLKNCNLDISILENSVAWSAKIQQQFLETSAQKLKMDPQEYLKKLKEILNSENVEFKFAKSEFVLQYTGFNNIKVKYLQCKLSKVQSVFDCVSKLLQNVYDEKNNAITEMSTLKEETEHLRKSTTDLESKLTEFISRKKKEEDILYSNFVLVLNEKKARIQHLTELLEAFRHGRPTQNPTPKVKEKPKPIKRPKVEVKNEVSESESDASQADYNTDDEQSRTDKKIVKENGDSDDLTSVLEEDIFKENVASTSKNYPCSSLLDDSPPSYVLPKRTKYNHKIEDSVSLPTYNPGSSKMDLSNLSKQESQVEEESPHDDYNTQDLLDRI